MIVKSLHIYISMFMCVLVVLVNYVGHESLTTSYSFDLLVLLLCYIYFGVCVTMYSIIHIVNSV